MCLYSLCYPIVPILRDFTPRDFANQWTTAYFYIYFWSWKNKYLSDTENINVSALGLNKHPDHNLIKVTKAFLIGYVSVPHD